MLQGLLSVTSYNGLILYCHEANESSTTPSQSWEHILFKVLLLSWFTFFQPWRRNNHSWAAAAVQWPIVSPQQSAAVPRNLADNLFQVLAPPRILTARFIVDQELLIDFTIYVFCPVIFGFIVAGIATANATTQTHHENHFVEGSHSEFGAQFLWTMSLAPWLMTSHWTLSGC